MSTATFYPRAWRAAVAAGLTVLCLAASPLASAALFEDDEARRAILDLRQRIEAQRLAGERQAEELRRAYEENGQMRRSLLELQNQIETLRGEVARLRGQDEQMARDLAEIQRRQ